MNPISQFNFSALPTPLKAHVLTFVGTEEHTIEKITPIVHQVLALMDKKSKFVFDVKIQKLYAQKRIPELVSTYWRYHSSYEYASLYWNKLSDPAYPSNFTQDKRQTYLEKFNPVRRPELLDALCTGSDLPNADHTQKKYTKVVENDIKDIVRLMPESVHCRLGSLRLRSEVPALGLACVNENIPIYMIEWLLEHGANPHETWRAANNPSCQVRIVTCLAHGSGYFELGYRRRELLDLFARYGATPDDPYDSDDEASVWSL